VIADASFRKVYPTVGLIIKWWTQILYSWIVCGLFFRKFM